MPLPLVPIAIAAGVLSVGATVHSTLKRRKWQKLHNEALSHAQQTGTETQGGLNKLNQDLEDLGRLCVDELETLKMAAEFLENAKVRHRDLSPELAEIPPLKLENWKVIHGEAIKSFGMGAAGATGTFGAGAATVAGLYTAAGIFGTASTETVISGLSGAAAHSARMAWLGGGALSAGGAGMAGGAATLLIAANVVMTPIALAAAFLSERQASKVQKQVEGKLKEFAEFETKMRLKQTLAKSANRRASEKRAAILKLGETLQRSLSGADPRDQEGAYGIYLQAKALSECLDSEVLSSKQLDELNS